MYHKYVDHGFVEYYGLQGFAIPLATVVITRHNILEVESWCDDKCLPPNATVAGSSPKISLQNIGDKAAYHDFLQSPQKWEFCALGMTSYTRYNIFPFLLYIGPIEIQ